MPLTSLNPNLLGQDSTGASKLNTAGGTAQLHSTGLFAIANNSANNFAVANNGNVGVGITAPTTTLHTKAPAFTDGIITIDATSTNVSQRLNLAANGTIQTQLYDDASQTILKSVTAKPLYLGANNSNIITVAANGNIGIGNTSPTNMLSVGGTAFIGGNTEIRGPSSSSAELKVNAPSYQDWTLSVTPNTIDYKANSTNHMRFMFSGAETVRFSSNSNVGIGTSSPIDKLDIAGAVRQRAYTEGGLGGGYTSHRFVIELTDGSPGSKTTLLWHADDNAAFKMTYYAHAYDNGTGNSNMMRVCEYYGACGSGGPNETAIDYYFVTGNTYGTLNGSQTPSLSVSSNYVAITYGGAGYASSRVLVVEWQGYALPSFHPSLTAPT